MADTVTIEVRLAGAGAAGQGLRVLRGELRDVGTEATTTGRKAVTGAGGLSVLERAGARLRTVMAGAHSGLTRFSAFLGGELATMAKRGAFALGGIVTLIAGFGLKASSQFQQARIAFDTLLGSAEAGKALFKQLQDINVKTPFELGEIAPATQLLLRYGVAADKVVPVLKSLLDAAALSGAPSENLQRLALATGQIMSQGRVLGQDARQLAEAGINVYDVFAQKLGITQAAARKLGQEGKLSADVFAEALINMEGPLAKLKGGAEKLSETLLGQLSNLKDAIKIRLADAAQPLTASLTAQIPLITELVGSAVDQLGPPVFRLVGMLATALTKLLPVAAPLLTALVNGLGDLAAAAAPAMASLAPLGDQIGSALTDLFTALVPIMPDVVRLLLAFVGILPDMIRLVTALVPFADKVINLASAFLEFRPVRGIMAGLLTALLGYRALSGVIGVVKGMATAIGLLNAAEAAGGGAAAAGATGATIGAGEAAAGGAAATGAAATGLGGPLAAGALLLGNANAAHNIGKHIHDKGFHLNNPFAKHKGSKSNLELAGSLFLGDVRGNLAKTTRLHGAAAGDVPGRARITSAIRNHSLASPSSGHRSGRAFDVRADYPHAYASAIRARGGYAKVHDAGTGRHVHAEIGDVTPAPWSGGDQGGGHTVMVDVTVENAWGDIDVRRAVADGVEDGLAQADGRKTRRGHTSKRRNLKG